MKRRIFMKRKLLAINLILTILLCFTACGRVISGAVSDADDGLVRDGLQSLDVAQFMGNGINLCNCLEGYAREDLGTDSPIEEYETFLGQEVVTQDMIDGMKAAGFDTLRIPVAFTNTMDLENGDYTIREDYLIRLKEIVDYARNVDMYVIIAEDTDGNWWRWLSSEDPAFRIAARNLYKAIWKQVAEYFKGYSDYILFEGGDKELGYRLNGEDKSGILSEEECYSVASEMNQLFVDTVRGTGGNNTNRFLIVPGYDSSITSVEDMKFVMPDDIVDYRLLISVHYYYPVDYTQNEYLNKWGNIYDYGVMNEYLAKMSNYGLNGYGVIISEYGVATEKGGHLRQGTLDYYRNFINNCDLYQYVPILWDNGQVYSRSLCEITNQELEYFFMTKSSVSREGMFSDDIANQAYNEITKDFATAPKELK